MIPELTTPAFHACKSLDFYDTRTYHHYEANYIWDQIYDNYFVTYMRNVILFSLSKEQVRKLFVLKLVNDVGVI